MARKSSLSGFKELREVFRQLPDAVQRRVTQQAVNAAAFVLRDAARKAAPRGRAPSPSSKQYGRLRINVKARPWRRGRNKNQKGNTVTTGDAFWGYMQEYGTGPYYIGPGSSSKGSGAETKLRPRAWFRPAMDANEGRAMEAMRARLSAGIARESERLMTRYRVGSK